jgi:hypothetical protein
VPRSWAHDHSPRVHGSGAIKKDKHPLSSRQLRLFEEMIMVVIFKENLIVDLDGPFCDFEHQDILKSRGVKTPEM